MKESRIDLTEMKERVETVSEVLKSLSHPQRLLILCSLCSGEKTVNEILEGSDLSQSHLSQILGRLKLENLIDSRKEGRKVVYRLKDERIKDLISSLQGIFCGEKG